jgi:hypothetical protein
MRHNYQRDTRRRYQAWGGFYLIKAISGATGKVDECWFRTHNPCSLTGERTVVLKK